MYWLSHIEIKFHVTPAIGISFSDGLLQFQCYWVYHLPVLYKRAKNILDDCYENFRRSKGMFEIPQYHVNHRKLNC